MHDYAMIDSRRTRERRLAALAHRSRIRIVFELLSGPRCITELAAAVRLSQSCTTRHVQALEAAGWVTNRRDGKRVRISLALDAPEAAVLLEWLGGPAGSKAEAGERARDPSGLAEPAALVHIPAPLERPESGKSPESAAPVGPERHPRSEPLDDYLL